MGLVLVGSRARSTQAPLREAVTVLSRAIEDATYTNLSTDIRDPTERDYNQRRDIIVRSRDMLRRSPLAKQAGSLLVNYVLGQGVSVTAANKTLVARLVDAFWNNPVNQMTLTSQQAMTDILLGAFTDGSQYFALFPDADEGTLEIGYLDALYVDDIVMDPNNSRIPLWYKVRTPKGGFDFEAGTYQAVADDDFVYYRHWRNFDGLDSDDDPDTKTTGPAKPKNPPASKIRPGLVYQMKRGKGRFGVSELGAALDWLKAHKEFMENRATITSAAASLAWRKKRKSGASDIANQVDMLRSQLSRSSGLGYETNPPPAPGSTIIENEGSTTEWIKTDTGGQAALADERILRMMAGSGMGGVPNHYFGDEANANLATATSMELPLLKNYESWQKWLGDAIGDIIYVALKTAHAAHLIGEDDNADKYVDRTMTAEQVVDTSQPRAPMPKPGAPGGPAAGTPSAFPAAAAAGGGARFGEAVGARR